MKEGQLGGETGGGAGGGSGSEPGDWAQVLAESKAALTALEASQEALREREARLRDIIEHSTNLFYAHDQEGRITYLSPQAREMLDCEASEAMGCWQEFTPDTPANREGYRRTARAIETGERQPPYVLELRSRRGRCVWVEVHESPVVRDGRTVAMVGSLTDITERRRAEENLRASEALHRTLFEQSLAAIFMTDAEGRFLEVNPAGCALVGFTVEEIRGRSFVDLIVPEDLESRPLQMDRLRREGQFAIERRLRCRDGRVAVVEIRSSLLPDGRIIGLARDVTETRQAEARLRASEERFRSMAEASPLGLHAYRLEADGRLVLTNANPAADAILGVSHAALVGRSIEEAFPGLRGGGVPAAYRKVCEGGGPWRSEQVDYRDGRIEGAFDVVAFRTGPGTMAVLFQDIRERLTAQAAIRLQSAALEATANGVLITDRNGRIVWCNEAFCRLTGYSLTELMGRDPRLLNSGQNSALMYEELWATIMAGRVWRGELVNRRKDGTLFTQEQTITPVRGLNGEINHFVAIQQDITERKRLEEQVRQAAKMESLGTLAGGVAHDFNNLLTVIQGHTTLAMGTDPANRAELQDNLRQVQLAAERAANLTRQLLAFSRQEAIRLKVLDLNEVIGRQTRMLRRIIGEDIVMQIHYATALPPIMADGGMMEQVLLNLAANARDAMPGGGTLLIGTEVVTVGEGERKAATEGRVGPHVLLTVQDTGVGIPAEVLPRIFEPFFTTKQVGKGTGLGLATVHGIVQRHGGWIEVESKLGRGTTIRIHLPAAGGGEGALELGMESVALPRGVEAVLIVEDEEPVRALARRVLEGCGYRVGEAGHGAEAMAMLEAEGASWDLLLTDLIMPGGMNGRELAERACGRAPGLKVIYMSGYSPGLIEELPMRDRKLYFLQKPFSPAQLAQGVRACLDG